LHLKIINQGAFLEILKHKPIGNKFKVQTSLCFCASLFCKEKSWGKGIKESILDMY
jgi:hypothetical protein